MLPDRVLPNLTDKTYGQMRWAINALPVQVKSAHLPDNVYGAYDESKQLILIDLGLTYTQKRCTLAHELIHWQYGDDTCQGQCGVKQELRARKLAAQLLVSPLEYQTVEDMYDGECFLIASELGITVDVVQDFQQLVLPRLGIKYRSFNLV